MPRRKALSLAFAFAWMIWSTSSAFTQEPGISDAVRLASTLRGPKPGEARGIAFAENGKTLVSSSTEGIHIWDLASAKIVRNITGDFKAFTVSASGRRLATFDRKHTVRIIDLGSQRELATFVAAQDGEKTELTAAKGSVALAFSPDGSRVAVLCSGQIGIWDWRMAKPLREIRHVRTVRPGDIDFFPDGSRITHTQYPEVEACIEDIDRTQPGESIDLFKYIVVGKLSPDGRTFAAGMWSRNVYLLPAKNSRIGGTFELRVRIADVPRSIAFRSDSRVMAVQANGGRIVLVHVKTAQVIDALPPTEAKDNPQSWPLQGLAFSPDGNLLAAETGTGAIQIWHVRQSESKLADFETLPHARAEQAWIDLAGYLDDDSDTDQPPPYWLLVSFPEEAVGLIGRKLKPAQSPNASQVKQWLADLSSSEYAKRKKASAELSRLGGVVKKSLEDALRKAESPESGRRIQRVLDEIENPWNPERVRQDRAMNVLYHLRTEDSLRLLRNFAAGDPDAFLTSTAKEYLEYLKHEKK